MDDIGKAVVSYWRKNEPIQNFGDFISEFLTQHLFYPYRADVRAVHIIGSVIHEMFVPEGDGPRILFWGCGFRDGQALDQTIKRNIDVLSVRGHLSASALGGDACLPVGDPGFLLPALYSPTLSVRTAGKNVCVPHFHERATDCELLAASGCDVVLRPNIPNREDALLEMIDAIASASFVLSASLHGCVVAAAYNKPFAYWNPGVTDLPFKWADLASSLNIPCLFAKNLDEGQEIHARHIAPVIQIPDLTQSLVRSPLLLRASGLTKILAWQRGFDGQLGEAGPSDLAACSGVLAERQNEIYDGIIEELRLWINRAGINDAAEAVREKTEEALVANIQRADALEIELADSARSLSAADAWLDRLSVRLANAERDLVQSGIKIENYSRECNEFSLERLHLHEMLEVKDAAIEAVRRQLASKCEEVSSLQQDLSSARPFAQQSMQHVEMGGQQALIGTLRRQLADSERQALLNQKFAKLVQDILGVVSAPDKWWLALLPSAWVRRIKYARLKRRGFFDADLYLKRYPDIARAHMDPLNHYIVHGMDEGRTRY